MLTYRAIVFFLVISVSAFSQSFEKDYQPIKSSGTIPDDFTFSTKKKIKEDLTKIEVVNTNAKENREYTILVEQLEIAASGKLRTSSLKEIPFEQQLLGTAEIVTEDKGFLERVLEQVTAGFK